MMTPVSHEGLVMRSEKNDMQNSILWDTVRA